MRLGHNPDVFRNHFGDEGYRKMREYGFAYADMFIDSEYSEDKSDESLETYWLEEQRKLREAGIEIFQVHGPWRYPPHDETEEIRAERMELMKQSLRCTEKLGCKYWVIHGLMPHRETGFRAEEVWKINLEFFRELLPYAKERGITICLENMPMPGGYPLAKPQQIMDFVNEIDDENFGVCLDTGHSWVCEVQPGEAARIFGSKLKVLHVHDNGGIKKGDQHLLPTLGGIDWNDFRNALIEIGYDKWGVYNLECSFSSVLPNPSISSELRAKMTQIVAEAVAPQLQVH